MLFVCRELWVQADRQQSEPEYSGQAEIQQIIYSEKYTTHTSNTSQTTSCMWGRKGSLTQVLR